MLIIIIGNPVDFSQKIPFYIYPNYML